MSIRSTSVIFTSGYTARLYCAGMTRLGISIQKLTAGATLLVTFQGSPDGVNWSNVNAAPYPAGAGVQTASGIGSWFFDSSTYTWFRCQVTTLTGSGSPSVTIILSAANDGSWQDAFMTAAQRFQNAVASSSGTLTVTTFQNLYGAMRLRTLSVGCNQVPNYGASPAVVVTDGPGGPILYAGDPPNTAGPQLIPLPADASAGSTPGTVGGGVVGTPGNALVVTVAPSAGKVNANLEVVPA